MRLGTLLRDCLVDTEDIDSSQAYFSGVNKCQSSIVDRRARRRKAAVTIKPSTAHSAMTLDSHPLI